MIELIYTTPLHGNTAEDLANVEDVGVLKYYNADFAFGKSENNFEIKMHKEDACLEQGSLVYQENGEVGGIVDAIKVDSNRQEVTYSGRTWQGIFASIVLRPDAGEDYLEYSNVYYTVVRTIVYRAGLDALCEVVAGYSTNNFGIKVRYENAYDVLKKYLEQNNLKVKMTMGRNHKIKLTVSPIVDYSEDEEVLEHIEYNAKRDYRAVNHIVCLGSGEMKNRYVIDLYFDEAGNVQPYLKTDLIPPWDGLYYTDNTNQVMTGVDEITEVYDYSGAETVEWYQETTVGNTIILEQWKRLFPNYYYYDEDEEAYVQYAMIHEEGYQMLSSRPNDWDTNFRNYFRKSGNDYIPADYLVTSNFTVLTQQPSDWYTKYSTYYTDFENHVEGITTEPYVVVANPKKDFEQNYSNYYTEYNDGTTVTYIAVSSVTKYYYEKQSQQPSDWETNYSHYYQRKRGGGYEAVTGKKSGNSYVAPNWGKRDYFTQKSRQVPPPYNSNETYYQKSKKTIAPEFHANTYYRRADVKTAPVFAQNTFYQYVNADLYPPKPEKAFIQRFDHYGDLIASALKKYNGKLNKDEMTVNVIEDLEYDVGDIVGAKDEQTGLFVTQKIVKKIYKIKNGKATIDYEEGGSLW